MTSSLILSSFAFSQTSGTTPVRPGSTTSAPRPGIAAPGQRPQTGTARIRGCIVAAQTGLPIRRALNTLGIRDAPASRTTTDASSSPNSRPNAMPSSRARLDSSRCSTAGDARPTSPSSSCSPTASGATASIWRCRGVAGTGWTVKSIDLDGEDVTDEPIDLTGRPSVSGVVISSDGQDDTDLQPRQRQSRPADSRMRSSVPVSRDPRTLVASRLMRVVHCDSSGAFQASGMRPGRYVVTAVTTVDQGYQYEPEFQQQLRRASESFTIREGEAMTLDVKLSGL